MMYLPPLAKFENYHNYTCRNITLAYTSAEINVFKLFKALGNFELQPKKITKWSKVKAIFIKKTKKTSTIAEIRILITQQFQSKLPSAFRILTAKNPIDISPLHFVATRVPSEPLFLLLLEFARNHDFVAYFSNDIRRYQFDQIAVTALVENDKIDNLTHIASSLKSNSPVKHFLHFKGLAAKALNDSNAQKKALIANNIQVTALVELIASYIIHPFPEILM